MSVLRHLLAASCALVLAGTAAAQSPAEQRAEQAMSALSARYQQIWSTLGAQERAAFSAQERAWLNRQRWDEHKRCVAHAGAAAAEERSALCQQAVVERRLQQLQTRVLLQSAARS